MKTQLIQQSSVRAALATVAFSFLALQVLASGMRAADANSSSQDYLTRFTWSVPVDNAPGSQHDIVLDYVSDPARRDASAQSSVQMSVVASPDSSDDADPTMPAMDVASGADPNLLADAGDQLAHRYRLTLHIGTPADPESGVNTAASYQDLGPDAAPYDTPVDLSDQMGAQPTIDSADGSVFADVAQFYVRMSAWSASGITTVRALSVDGAAFDIPRELGTSRLSNVSARAQVGTGDSVLIAGFVTSGTDQKNILVRGVGPGLASFGISGALTSTSLAVFNQSSALSLGSAQGWASEINADLIGSVASQEGAFALTPGSLDSASYLALPSGAYTAQLAGANNNTGLGLIELYDADSSASSGKIVNFSARAQVGTGDKIVIAGFNVVGLTPRTLLLRAVGPTLGSLGVTGTLAQPVLSLYSNGSLLAQNAGWSTAANAGDIRTAMPQAGAFALPDGSTDSAILVTLNPGTYTLQVSSGKGAGMALVEIYDLAQE